MSSNALPLLKMVVRKHLLWRLSANEIEALDKMSTAERRVRMQAVPYVFTVVSGYMAYAALMILTYGLYWLALVGVAIGVLVLILSWDYFKQLQEVLGNA